MIYTREELKSETVITRCGKPVTVTMNAKTRISTGRTDYEVTTKGPGGIGGGVDARTMAAAEKNFAKCLTHFRTKY